MKSKHIVILVCVAMLLGSCSYPRYLPSEKKLPKWEGIAESQYGATIAINLMDGSRIDGELLAVYDDKVFVDVRKSSGKYVDLSCKEYKLSDVKYLAIRYARPRKYAVVYFMPLVSISHGYFAMFTLPINLISAPVIVNSANKSYRLELRDVAIDNLRMFARFPQGLPSQAGEWCDFVPPPLPPIPKLKTDSNKIVVPKKNLMTFMKIGSAGYVLDSLENMSCECITYVDEKRFRYAVLMRLPNNTSYLKIKIKDSEELRTVYVSPAALEKLMQKAKKHSEQIEYLFYDEQAEEEILKSIAGENTEYNKIE